MLYIRQNSKLVKQRLELKNFKELNLVDEIFELDKEKRSIQAIFDSKQRALILIMKKLSKRIRKNREIKINKLLND